MPEPITDPAATQDIDPKAAVRKSFKAMAMKVWDDETLEQPAFLAKMKDLRKKQTDVLAKLGDDDPTNDPTPEEIAAEPGVEVAGPIAASRETTPAAATAPANPFMVELMAENRRGKLSLAVQRGEITPAASKELEALFIGENNCKVVEALKLSLSNDNTPDMFEPTLKAVMAQGAAVGMMAEQSPRQTLSLDNPSGGGNGKDNPLVANAKKLKAADEARRAARR